MLFQLRDGLIYEVREYMNPLMAAPLMGELAAMGGSA
jgi:ketosteroid isomerase-like protein